MDQSCLFCGSTSSYTPLQCSLPKDVRFVINASSSVAAFVCTVLSFVAEDLASSVIKCGTVHDSRAVYRTGRLLLFTALVCLCL